MINCLHVRVLKVGAIKFKTGIVYAVMSREFTPSGIIYHLCDNIGKYIGSVTDEECQPLEF